MKHRSTSLALTWLVLLLIPVPLVVILNRGLVDTPGHLLAYDLGIFAYVWWLLIVILSTRPYWLTQRIGMPALYGIHGALGVMALVAATIHRFASFTMFPLIKQTGEIAWYLEIFLLAYAVLFLSGWLVDHLRRVAGVKSWFEHHLLNHQVTMWIHRLNFVVIALIWLHVQLIPRLGNVAGFRIVFDVYTVVALLIYAWWKLGLRRTTSSATVVENEPLGSTERQLTLRLAGDNSSYHAGDFYFLAFKKVRGLSAEPHPFSVSSVPKVHPDEVSFTIHQVGDFTRQLASVPVGTSVKLEGPFGLFDSEIAESNRPVILYGLGSGVAPLLSLAQQYAGKKQLHLIWSGAQADNPAYQKIIAQLKQAGVTVNAQLHRFSAADLQKVISDEEVKNALVIVVGSANKVIAVEHLLGQLGFSKARLHDERMTM